MRIRRMTNATNNKQHDRFTQCHLKSSEERELYNQARESARLAKVEATPKALLETGPF